MRARAKPFPAVAVYGVAAAAALLAALVRLALNPWLGGSVPFITVFPLLMLIAALVGPKPALLSGIVATLVVQLGVNEPAASPDARWLDLCRLAFVLVSSTLVGSVAWQLRQSVAQAAVALDGINDAFIVLDDQWYVRYVNQRAGKMAGQASPSALRGRLFWAVWPCWSDPELRSRLEQALQQARKRNRTVRLEHLHTDSGAWSLISVTPDQKGLNLLISDITEHKRFSDALAASEARSNLAQQAGGVGVFDWDVSNDQVHWSAELQNLFGLQPGEFKGTFDDWTTRVDPQHVQQITQLIGQCASQRQREISFEFRFNRDGQERWMEGRGTLFYNGEGKLVRVLGTNMDITERRRARLAMENLNATLEQQVSQRTAEAESRAEQLRVLAAELTLAEQRERQRIAAVLHDELAQTLAMCRTRLSAVQDQGSPRQNRQLQQADVALNNAIEQTRRLMEDLSPPMLHDLGLVPALEGLADRLAQRTELKVTVQGEPEHAGLGHVVRSVVFLLVEEMLIVAGQWAHCPTASLTIDSDSGNSRITLHFEHLLNQSLLLQLRSRPALLSLVERLELLGGRVRFLNQADTATVVVLAPLAGPASFEPATEPSLQSPWSPGAKTAVLQPTLPAAPTANATATATIHRLIDVIVVDDHKIVREGLVGLLQGQSDIRVVTEASDGVEAVELARKHHPHVVVMDISMPRMNGIDATRAIVAEMPDIKIIGLSMHEEEDLSNRIRQAGAVSYLSKGGPIGKLIDEIRRHGNAGLNA
jgi:PAS domain S-box-containing protein